MITCAVDGCDRAKQKREWCDMHYKRWYRTGDPLIVAFDRRANGLGFEDSILAHSRSDGDCRLWTASTHSGGYPQMKWQGRILLVHQEVYRRTHGQVPAGLEVDHRCRNRSCVNPAHLRLATSSQNKENQGIRADNSSGFRGVSRYKDKWRAQVKANGHLVLDALYTNPEDAAAAARAARLKAMTHNELDRVA